MSVKIVLLWGDQELQTLWGLPVLRRLRRNFPEAHLQFLAGESTGELLAQLGYIDEHLLLNIHQWKPWFLGNSTREDLLASSAYSILSEASLVISWLPDALGVFAQNLQLSGVEQGCFLQADSFVRDGQEAQVQLAFVLEQLAIFREEKWEPLLELEHLAVEEFRLGVKRGLGGSGENRKGENGKKQMSRVVLEPCAVQEHEHWPLDRWDGLLRDYLADAAPASQEIWVSLPDSMHGMERQQALREQWSDLPIHWAIGWSLWERLSLLAGAQLYLGHNLSSSQLALALEVPSLLLLAMREQELRTWQAQGLGQFVQLNAPLGVIGRLSVAQAKEALKNLLATSS